MMDRSWTFGDAVKFLKYKIIPIAEKAGYKAEIIGSILNKGYSDKDLDILLTPIREETNFELILDKFPGDFTMDMETYVHITDEGKVVDFWTKENK